MTESRRATDVVPLQIVEDNESITREELATLKKLAANYRAAQYGMTALVAIGGLIAVGLEAWHAFTSAIGK